MCGIVGLVTEPDRALNAETVRQMSHAVARRGPDAEGYENWPGASLGHRRLSIFDLSSAGAQPMTTTDRSVGIVFNGAIYNFPELRSELEAAGCRFHSQTDTEVLLQGYREWGVERLVGRIRGMYAFAIWDDPQQTLCLVRDRLGVKPLLYSLRDDGIAFASSARALRDAGWASELDPQAVTDFLEYGYVTEERTIYKGVRKLPAATVLTWKNGHSHEHRYWSPPAADAPGKISFEEAVEEAERLFLVAVERRLFADVPLCALLSGGVDSGLVCWAIARLGADITAYTVATPGDPWDESKEARDTARTLGIEHRILEMTPGPSTGVDLLVSAYGEPFACASALGMLDLSQAIKPNATVLLTGDGGDDVFLGYPTHRHLYYAEQLATLLPPGTEAAWGKLRNFIPHRGALGRGVHFVDYASGGLGAVAAAHEGIPQLEADGMLGEQLRGKTVDARRIPWSRHEGRRVLAGFLEHDRRGRFVSEYLTKVDGATMYHALEARSPFLDTDLWEFAAALPYSVRLRGGKLKAVLRELARRRIGERVAHGSKRGFGVPVQRWMAGPWREAVKESFRDSVLHEEGWVNAPAVLRRLDAAEATGWAPNRLFYAYVLEAWLKEERQAGPQRIAAASKRGRQSA